MNATKKPPRFELILRTEEDGAFSAEVYYFKLSGAKKDLGELQALLASDDPCRLWHGMDVSKVTSSWIADRYTGEILVS